MVNIPPTHGDLRDGVWHCFTHIMTLFSNGKATNVGKTMPFAPSLSHHDFYRWDSNHSQSWLLLFYPHYLLYNDILHYFLL
jgi:hypothetical protein